MKKENEQELISVIIPVYNVEKYLEKCLNSVINQTYKNIEIILIDDGSTDKSGTICEKFSHMYNNITMYQTKNNGAAAARNLGIRKAKGDYICFVDSDDEIKERYIEYLYYLIKKYNTKMSISSYIISSGKKNYDIGKKNVEQKLDTVECLKRLMLSQGFSASLCAKMYEKKIFDTIIFPEGNVYEDDATTYKIIMNCCDIAYGNESNYIYFVRKNSVMTKKFSESRLILLKYAADMKKNINNIYPELKEYVEKKYIDYEFSIIRQMVNSNLNEEMKLIENKLIEEIKKNTKKILFSNLYGIKEKAGIISLIFGKKIYKLIWSIYEKIKY